MSLIEGGFLYREVPPIVVQVKGRTVVHCWLVKGRRSTILLSYIKWVCTFDDHISFLFGAH